VTPGFKKPGVFIQPFGVERRVIPKASRPPQCHLLPAASDLSSAAVVRSKRELGPKTHGGRTESLVCRFLDAVEHRAAEDREHNSRNAGNDEAFHETALPKR
jgi:hypothetical protein